MPRPTSPRRSAPTSRPRWPPPEPFSFLHSLRPRPFFMFEHIPPFAGDPILSLNEDFQRDPRPNKINLSIGIYFDDEGRIPVLDSVKRAEAKLLAADGPKPYLPMEGAANFRSAAQVLLFGAQHEAVASGRIATIQAVGSSG